MDPVSCPHSGSGCGVNMIIDFTEFSRPPLACFAYPARGDGHHLFPDVRADGVRDADALVWYLRPRGALVLLKPVLVWIGRRQEKAILSNLKSYLTS
jgi:hypothetical protein